MTRDALHQLLDSIPAEKLAAAERFLAALREVDPEEAGDVAAWFAAGEQFDLSGAAPIPWYQIRAELKLD
ncbi:MAG: hypothetical protein F9K16_13120 [Thermoanaerobaculia bacterium]|nr:MAG: hypothetical protein F9K16_13120 [Thermoanaerobaculia bacterium]MBZ0102276.1 hypothetical protein [Thermoanaerobaculia bacterium]